MCSKTDVLVVVYLCINLMQPVTSLDDTVTLQLRGIDCSGECIETPNGGDDVCYSSIKVNNQEASYQEIGLNVVIINATSGETKTTFFDYLATSKKRKSFVNFFNSVNNGSVVVIVSEEMCDVKYTQWYNYLQKRTGLFVPNAWKSGSTTAVVVGCKGECPRVINGPKLPYAHFDKNASHTVEIVFLKTGAVVSTPKPASASSANKTPLIIGIVFGLLSCLLIVIALFIFRKTLRTPKHLFICFTKRSNTSNEEEGEESQLNPGNNSEVSTSPAEFSNQSYGGKLDQVVKISSKSDTKSSECATYAGYKNNKTSEGGNVYEYAKKVTDNGHAVRTEQNEYMYAEPNFCLEKKSENIYYSSGKTVAPNNNTSETDVTRLSSPGTSHQIFKKTFDDIQRDDSVQTNNFARYVKLDINDGPVYKEPSGVPKFSPPIALPKGIPHGNGDTDGHNNYDNSLYQPLATTVQDSDNTYEVLTRT